MTRSILTIFGMTALGVLAVTARGQDRPAPEAGEFAKVGAPGPEHERLQALVGTWTLTVDGVKETGKAEIKPLFGGRFVTEEVRLPLGGFTMEWLGVYGFDPHKKKYTAVWVDSMDTTTESALGEIDPTGRILSFRGDHIHPRTKKSESYLWRITRDGDARLTIAMFEIDAAGKERPTLLVRGEKVK